MSRRPLFRAKPRPPLSRVLALVVGLVLTTSVQAISPLRGPPHHRTTVPAAAAPCVQLSARLPHMGRALCDAAGLVPTEGRSTQGRTLYARDVVAPQVRLRVLVVGAMHGDEMSSASVALHWIQHALKETADTHWRFIPVLNPDGLLARPASRVNARGVDLNRNFPTPNWERDAPVYWEQRTRKDPRRWPGPSPLSEPESRFLHDEMARFQPHLIVSIHAPYGVLDFDGPGAPPPKLGRLYLDQVGIFPGSLGNYGGVHRGMPVVTIELPNAFRAPLESEMRQMWMDLQRWMVERLRP
ncbi:carboxypeptidase [Hydrogenophaga sp. Root209]|uniref:M14 family murein peptide amidase A n=1 Tax=Hydrogenophaga sp. Root209 TaxID=1736490 RepID=UPI0006FF00A1|nr:M14 family murein peptide amidase A [Hydrogenophaga sp. Root209]KRC12215.1 carboxypeptidase [Hydrogenophaga sp. Root209]